MLIPFPAGRPIMVAGPTGCGKTSWITRLLQSRGAFTEPVRSVLYCYGVWQSAYDEMKTIIPNITFHKGLPKQDTVEQLHDGEFHVIVLDDLMEVIVDSLPAQMLFTKFCHHYNISTIFVSQNVLAQGKCARNISLNTQILILFQNHRDRNQVAIIARQQSPDHSSLFLQAFKDATRKPYRPLVVDCSPECENRYRWRTNVLPDEGTCKYYMIRQKQKRDG